ncbi:hypothetical protein [Paenibacillus xanthanilyticus]|uniref:MCM AAA-lid domain-containing protein n=1 Tax=Paenibacillus xanthanilyticus TaxID=1783531 RepID=A0ABV8K0Q1_9BACL
MGGQQVNEQELVRYIAGKTNADEKSIGLVLRHAAAFMERAQAGRKGEVDVDIDDIVDYVMTRKDVRLSELAVESILEAEMDYLMDKGLAGYID